MFCKFSSGSKYNGIKSLQNVKNGICTDFLEKLLHLLTEPDIVGYNLT